MKKLVLFAAVALSMSMFSCGKGEKAEAADTTAVDSANVEVVDTVAAPADSAAVDTVANA